MGAYGETGWFLAQLKPNALKVAQRNLERQGFDVFVPLEETTRRLRQGFATALKPLFAGYVFVAFDPEAGLWRTVNSTLGIARLVQFGTTPARVPDALVEGLRQRCDETGRFLGPEAFQPGERVEMTSGPFADFIATVDRLAPDQRVWVLIELMGTQTRVSVDSTALRKA